MGASKTYFSYMTWAQVVSWVINSRGWPATSERVERVLSSSKDLTRDELIFLRALRNI
jgi:hypothetical protein